jgi:GntR family transcriptional regulator/MocR family aminotransferase
MNTNYKFALDRIKKEYLKQENIKPTNKYVVLYRAIKQCILNVELPNHWLLPSTRVLAQEMQLSRTTINKAFELLQLEKLIYSKPGSGNTITFEKPSLERANSKTNSYPKADQYPEISEKGHSYLNNIALINRLPDRNLAFRPGLPPIDVFPVNQWKKLLNTYWRHIKSSGLAYSQSTGLEELKKSIANYLNISRNIKCNHSQIVIVSGSLQSLYLISNTLINKGDAVILENPVFPNVHSVFKSSQATLIPISLDNEGIDIKQLNSLTDYAKLVHVTPSNHYPSGIKMSMKRRQDLLQWASKHKALIIENDYENEIANTLETLPTLFNLDTEDRTIYAGTFNRLLHPSIRLGYMIVPKYLTNAVQALQEHSHRFVSPSIQVVMTQFIEKNHLYQHLKNSIDVAKKRHDLFIAEFKKVAAKMHIEAKPFSSFHVIALFNEPTSLEEEKQVITKLEAENISAFSLSKCYIGEPKQKGIIFGYAAVRSSVIINKIQKMVGIV